MPSTATTWPYARGSPSGRSIPVSWAEAELAATCSCFTRSTLKVPIITVYACARVYMTILTMHEDMKNLVM